MKIKMCAFIPKSLGHSLAMCDLPKGLANQSSFNSDVRNNLGSWIKEPYPSTVFCGTDDREFGNVHGTNRLYAINEKRIDLTKIGRFQAAYGSKSKIFSKYCDLSHRVFVQTSHEPLSIWQMDRSPKIHYQGGRFAYTDHRKQYGYLHTQGSVRGLADDTLDTVRDISTDHSVIEVETVQDIHTWNLFHQILILILKSICTDVQTIMRLKSLGAIMNFPATNFSSMMRQFINIVLPTRGLIQ